MISIFVMDAIGGESKGNDKREEIMSEQSVSLQEPTIFSQDRSNITISGEVEQEEPRSSSESEGVGQASFPISFVFLFGGNNSSLIRVKALKGLESLGNSKEVV